MKTKSVPCPLGASCSKGGRHLPGSQIMEEHVQASIRGGSVASQKAGGVSPTSFTSSGGDADDISMTSPGTIFGEDIGLGPESYMDVYEVEDGEEENSFFGNWAATGYSEFGEEVEETDELVRAGFYESKGRDENDDIDYALSRKGLNALTHFLRSDFQGEEEIRDLVDVDYERDGSGERVLRASVSIPVLSAGGAFNNRERDPQDVASDYLKPLHDTMTDLLDPESGSFFRDRLMGYDAIPPSERFG